ncbi:MAG: sigma-70 family RNA polymerase sigma factor [Pirellulaceae bacterium]
MTKTNDDGITSLSLLDKVKRDASSESTSQLVYVYAPLLRRWLRRYSIQDCDVDDLVQTVLATVFRELPRFDHNGRPGAFRSWLRLILVNRLRAFWRSGRYRPTATGDSDLMKKLDELADETSSLSRVWDEEYDRRVIAQLIDLVQPKVAPNTWEAFRRQAIEGESAADAARDLNMSIDAVYAAKSRVLRMLRQEAAGLMD